MSRYDHKIENCLEGIDHLSKQKKEVNDIEVKSLVTAWRIQRQDLSVSTCNSSQHEMEKAVRSSSSLSSSSTHCQPRTDSHGGWQ